MRTSRQLGVAVAVLMGLGLASALAFDSTRRSNGIAPASANVEVFRHGAGTSEASLSAGDLQTSSALRHLTPFQAFRIGAQALRAGDTKSGILSLEYAAASGHPIAQWKLGRMYADGDGVKQSDLKAFEYFREVADAYADGIPNSSIKSDPDRAREMFTYAASYFGDADAQYQLGRMYAEGTGGVKDVRQAARWLQLAATKGQYQAQALLGAILFKGDAVPRQAARGLMWLTLARDAATPQETWIVEMQKQAFNEASDQDRAAALAFIERWVRGGRKE
jgi:TPR repeat protein